MFYIHILWNLMILQIYWNLIYFLKDHCNLVNDQRKKTKHWISDISECNHWISYGVNKRFAFQEFAKAIYILAFQKHDISLSNCQGDKTNGKSSGQILHQNTDARKCIEFHNIVASEKFYHFEGACIGYPRPSPGGRVGVRKDRKRESSRSRGMGKRERPGVGWFNHGGYHNP